MTMEPIYRIEHNDYRMSKESASRPSGGDPSSGADEIKVLVGGGTAAAALPASARRLSSRVNLLHGTSEEAAERILREGILPPSRTGNHGITRAALGSSVADQPLVYVSKDTPHGRHQSRWYAQQAEYFDEARRRGMTDNQAMLHRYTGVARSPRGKILRVSLPYDELMSKIRSNPEVELADKTPDRKARALTRASLRSAVALEGGVDTRYIKGSKDYQRQTLKEIADYARRNPGRFATGLGLGGVGLAGAALAAKGVHGLVSRGSSGNSDRVIERENALRKQASAEDVLSLGLHGWSRGL